MDVQIQVWRTVIYIYIYTANDVKHTKTRMNVSALDVYPSQKHRLRTTS